MIPKGCLSVAQAEKCLIRGTNSPQRRATVARCVECHQAAESSEMPCSMSLAPCHQRCQRHWLSPPHVMLHYRRQTQSGAKQPIRRVGQLCAIEIARATILSMSKANQRGLPQSEAWARPDVKTNQESHQLTIQHHIIKDVKVTACQHHRLCCRHRRHASAMPPNRTGREPHHAPYT